MSTCISVMSANFEVTGVYIMQVSGHYQQNILRQRLKNASSVGKFF